MYNYIHVDGLVVDPFTGEIICVDDKPSVLALRIDYQQPTKVENIAKVHFEFDALQPGITDIEIDALPSGVVDLDAERSRRGPKPKVQINSIASLINVAHNDHLGWVDDYVFAACYTVCGESKGKLNVNPTHVLRACLLDEISVEVVKRAIRLAGLRTMSDQQARRVCQCSRFAIDGMKFYLDRNPTVRQRLQFEVDFTESYYESHARNKVDLITLG